MAIFTLHEFVIVVSDREMKDEKVREKGKQWSLVTKGNINVIQIN